MTRYTHAQSAISHIPAPATGATGATTSAIANRRLQPPSTGSPPKLEPIITSQELPGPLGIASLAKMGAIKRLDDNANYLADQAVSVQGRAAIVNTMMPANAVACLTLALWVWIGGLFPNSLTVVSHSHFRTAVHGRPIRVLDRRLPSAACARLGSLWLTSPERTVCDLACAGESLLGGIDPVTAIIDLMEEYELTAETCLNILHANTRWPGHAHGVETLQRIALAYSTVDEDGDADGDETADGNGRMPAYSQQSNKTTPPKRHQSSHQHQ